MHFIYEDYLEDITLCDDIVSAFNTAVAAGGRCAQGTVGAGVVDLSIKRSTDMVLPPEIAPAYHEELQKLANKYIAKFPAVNEFAPWGFAEGMNVQHYAPNEGYYAWHTERSNATYPICTRMLVFLTYLNDVNDGGGTEFLHQKIVTTAKKGKTLIWPADWTYTHRGQVSPTEDKYIVTGWFNYLA